MESLVCRTCLKTNLVEVNLVHIVNKTEVTQMSLKDMLETFMPEMDLDISENVTVLCVSCSEFLKNAYLFRNMCLKTEETIYGYLNQNNIELGKKINLGDVLSYKNRNEDCDSKSEAVLDCKSPRETKTDSYKNSVEFDMQIYISDSETDSEKKEVKTPIIRPKRRRANISKKKKKTIDYNALKRSYTCDLCEYKAYRLDLLNSHKRKHDANVVNAKEFKCDLCMYSTPRKRALDRHLFTHKGKSRHTCQVCHKTFAEKYQLSLHSIKHTGQELPHKCAECGKGYLTKSYLKQHVETRHLAKKKSFCSECAEDNCEHAFSRYYKCDTCESSFSDKRGLDAHKFTHTGGELPFKCFHCNFSTAWKRNLKKHLQSKH